MELAERPEEKKRVSLHDHFEIFGFPDHLETKQVFVAT